MVIILIVFMQSWTSKYWPVDCLSKAPLWTADHYWLNLWTHSEGNWRIPWHDPMMVYTWNLLHRELLLASHHSNTVTTKSLAQSCSWQSTLRNWGDTGISIADSDIFTLISLILLSQRLCVLLTDKCCVCRLLGLEELSSVCLKNTEWACLRIHPLNVPVLSKLDEFLCETFQPSKTPHRHQV